MLPQPENPETGCRTDRAAGRREEEPSSAAGSGRVDPGGLRPGLHRCPGVTAHRGAFPCPQGLCSGDRGCLLWAFLLEAPC